MSWRERVGSARASERGRETEIGRQARAYLGHLAQDPLPVRQGEFSVDDRGSQVGHDDRPREEGGGVWNHIGQDLSVEARANAQPSHAATVEKRGSRGQRESSGNR